MSRIRFADERLPAETLMAMVPELPANNAVAQVATGVGKAVEGLINFPYHTAHHIFSGPNTLQNNILTRTRDTINHMVYGTADLMTGHLLYSGAKALGVEQYTPFFTPAPTTIEGIATDVTNLAFLAALPAATRGIKTRMGISEKAVPVSQSPLAQELAAAAQKRADTFLTKITAEADKAFAQAWANTAATARSHGAALGAVDVGPIVSLIEGLFAGNKNAQVLARIAERITNGADAAARSSGIRVLVDTEVGFTRDAQFVTALQLDFHGVREILLDRVANDPDASVRLAAVEGVETLNGALMSCYNKLSAMQMDHTNPGGLKLRAEVAATLHDMRDVMQSIAKSDAAGAVQSAASQAATRANAGYVKVLENMYYEASFKEANPQSIYPDQLPRLFLGLQDGSPEVISMINRGTEFYAPRIRQSAAAMTIDHKQPMLGRVVDVNQRGEVGSSYRWADDGNWGGYGYGRHDGAAPSPRSSDQMSEAEWNRTHFTPTRPRPADGDMSKIEWDYYHGRAPE